MASIQVDPGKGVRIATACTECQRRKQKVSRNRFALEGGDDNDGCGGKKNCADIVPLQCSREWPCNHCQARRIAHLCKFVPKKVLARSGGNAPASASTPAASAAGNNTR